MTVVMARDSNEPVPAKAFSKWLSAALLALGGVCVVTACSDEVDTASASNTTSSSQGGANSCSAGFDTPCEMCASSMCMTEALECANLSECNAVGDPTSGCLAIAACAGEQCDCNSIDYFSCILDICGEELNSAGGPDGHGTMAAMKLGDCAYTNCPSCGVCGIGGSGGG